METGIQSSFIPHDTSSMGPAVLRQKSGGLPALMLLLSIVAFIASLALAAGVFMYQQYLVQSSASKSSALQRAKAAFEPSLISQLTRLDDRMHSADSVLASHIAPSILFKALEESTLSTVSFTSFNIDTIDPAHLGLHMSGVAESVNSIALQAEVFSKSGIFSGPIFSGIDRQRDGVHFDFRATVNPSSLNYTHGLVSDAQAAPAAAAPEESHNPFVGPSVSNSQANQQSAQPAAQKAGQGKQQ